METKKYLDQEGVKYLWSKISMEDYPNNETLMAVINAIDETKANADSVLLKTQQTLTEEELTQVHNNLKIAGQNVAGKQYTINDIIITANNYAEVFNNYSNNIAIGDASHAEGGSTTARGPYSHAEGYGTTANGSSSHAEGYGTTADGLESHAEGSGTTASGSKSHAEGLATTASEEASHAEGLATIASGRASHAEGYNNTTASGNYSHAEGNHSTASGEASHAEGSNTTATGLCSHAEGFLTKANANYQHVQGFNNIIDQNNQYLHIVGNGDYTTSSNAHTIDWDGLGWFAGGLKVGGTSQNDTGSKEVAIKDEIPTKVSQLENDSNFVTEEQFTLQNLNIVYSETEPTVVEGGIWLQPIS